MEKVKKTFTYIGQLIVNPIKKIASIPISDRFMDFLSKHVWLRILVSFVLAVLVVVYVYYLK